MTTIFDEFGYNTSWWSTIIAGVVIFAGILIIIKTCLDCPGLVNNICCCGHNPDTEIPIYKLDIVYRVSISIVTTTKTILFIIRVPFKKAVKT